MYEYRSLVTRICEAKIFNGKPTLAVMDAIDN